jgi:hypothetical protein
MPAVCCLAKASCAAHMHLLRDMTKTSSLGLTRPHLSRQHTFVTPAWNTHVSLHHAAAAHRCARFTHTS